ncbi:MAG: hypothetical protein JW925_07775 [Syntrophaceae bacterium]|nr:hypothetical protein [Syntrophaceae bacterium]
MKPTKKTIQLIILVVAAFSLPYSLPADYDETITVIHKDYEPPAPTYLYLGYGLFAQQKIVDKADMESQKDSVLDVSLGTFSTGKDGIKHAVVFGYRRLKAEQIGYELENISDFSAHIGGRYYPYRPTFTLGKIPVRFTFSALGGVDWLSVPKWKDRFAFSILLSGGLAICPGKGTSGFLLEFLYRPVSTDLPLKNSNDILKGTLLLKPSWCLTIAWLFGPAE